VARLGVLVAAYRSCVRDCFTFDAEARGLTPTIVGMREKLEIGVGVHTPDGLDAELDGLYRRGKVGRGECSDNAVGAFGDFRRWNLAAAIEDRCARVMRAVRIGRDDDH